LYAETRTVVEQTINKLENGLNLRRGRKQEMKGKLQNAFTNSISPGSLSKLRKNGAFSEFMEYLQRDYEIFIETHDKLDSFLEHYKIIQKQLMDRELLHNFIERIDFHSKLRDYKISALDEYLPKLFTGYNSILEEILEDLKRDIGNTVSFPIDKQQFEALTDRQKESILEAEERIQLSYNQLVGVISGLINTIFFAFESSCKISCSLGCWEFAISFSTNNIIQHDSIWKTLRKLGKIAQEKTTRCDRCLMDKGCDFEIDFEALANSYCYAIQMRMLMDYEIFFYENSKVWNQVTEYFKKLREIIDCQKAIQNKCLENKTHGRAN
jgi:hypothetical protein